MYFIASHRCWRLCSFTGPLLVAEYLYTVVPPRRSVFIYEDFMYYHLRTLCSSPPLARGTESLNLGSREATVCVRQLQCEQSSTLRGSTGSLISTLSRGDAWCQTDQWWFLSGQADAPSGEPSLPSQHIEGNKPPPITPSLLPRPPPPPSSPTERQKRESGLQTKAGRENAAARQERQDFACEWSSDAATVARPSRHTRFVRGRTNAHQEFLHKAPSCLFTINIHKMQRWKVTKYIYSSPVSTVVRYSSIPAFCSFILDTKLLLCFLYSLVIERTVSCRWSKCCSEHLIGSIIYSTNRLH